MAAKESAEMAKARDLVINEGMTAYKAGNLSGISPSAIYMAPWYKKLKADKTADTLKPMLALGEEK